MSASIFLKGPSINACAIREDYTLIKKAALLASRSLLYLGPLSQRKKLRVCSQRCSLCVIRSISEARAVDCTSQSTNDETPCGSLVT